MKKIQSSQIYNFSQSVFFFVHRLTHKLNRCFSECPWSWPCSRSLSRHPERTGIRRVPTTRLRECGTETVRPTAFTALTPHTNTHKSLPWTRPPVRWTTRGRRPRRRRRSACTRAPPSAAAAATASSTAAQHHTRALAAVRPSVRATDRTSESDRFGFASAADLAMFQNRW